VNAALFGLAFTAALNPKLLGADLLILENRRPRAMFICFLAGGLGMSITIGIVDVLFVQADAVKKGRCLDSNWREDLYRLNRSQSWLPTLVTQAGSATTAHISTCLTGV
jgi:hypothetical protein